MSETFRKLDDLLCRHQFVTGYLLGVVMMAATR